MSTLPIIIRPKDLQIIYKCSPATATRKFQILKDVFKKKPHQSVTIAEFCSYSDIPEETIIKAIS
jgi:hypothetical protein